MLKAYKLPLQIALAQRAIMIFIMISERPKWLTIYNSICAVNCVFMKVDLDIMLKLNIDCAIAYVAPKFRPYLSHKSETCIEYRHDVMKRNNGIH